MPLTLLSPAAAEPVTLSEMKNHLRLTDAAEDAVVASALAAATRSVEARGGLALMTQGWRLTLDARPEETLFLPIAPVTAIDAVTVSGVAVDPSAYEFAPGSPARFRPSRPWPAPQERIGGVTIDFSAGYASAGEAPPPLRQAVKLLAAHFFENREAATETRTFSVPATVDALIAPFREVRL
ncbi:MAG: head-tail connector protein [Pseudomonadota bacterium]